jgi:hypothetical protein
LDFFSNQYLRLLLRPDDLAKALAAEDFDLHRVYYKMLDGAYLGKTIDGLKDLTDRKMTFQRKRARRFLKTQLILVFLAYVVLFVAGIPSV